MYIIFIEHVDQGESKSVISIYIFKVSVNIDCVFQVISISKN